MFLNQGGIDLSAVAIKDEYGKQISYLQLENMAVEYGAVIKPRSLVMILCDYDIDTVSFYYCMLAGQIVPMLVNARLNRGMLEQLIALYRPQYIWKLAEGEAGIRKNRHVLVKTNDKPVPMHPNLALLLTTSGSTGSPKFVRVSYGNIVSNAGALSEYLELQSDDIAVTTLPFFYCYGLSVIHMHWHVGATVCVTDKSMMQKGFWDFLEKSGATNFASVPYQYDILEKLDFIGKKYASLRFLTVGGSKLPKARQELFGKAFHKKKVRFYMMYGQTEGTAVLSGIPCDKVLDKPGSIGLPLPGLRVAIDPNSMEGNGAGELVFYGDSVSMGYAGSRQDLKEGDVNGGALHTGDTAYMDGEGYIYLKGRKKRFVKILGARVSLDEVESILQTNFNGGEIACVGTDGKIAVFYEGEIEEGEMKKFIADKFLIHPQMAAIKKIEKIPRTSYGKIEYEKLYGEIKCKI